MKLTHIFFATVFILLTSILSGQTTHVVNALNDESVDTDDLLSFREAIAGAGSFDIIEFDSNLFTGGAQTIILSEGELDIGVDLQIFGPGSELLTVSGNTQSRVFSIAENIYVELWDMTISNGKVTASETVYGGGGIINRGTLLLEYCVIDNNEVVASALYGGGGAGVLNIVESTSLSSATTYVEYCTFSNNTISGSVGRGGAVCNISLGNGSTFLSVYDSAFAYNTSTFSGSAVGTFVDGTGYEAASDIYNCTVSGNMDLGSNGALACDTISPSEMGATLKVINSTITDNLNGGLSSISSSSNVSIGNNIIAGNLSTDILAGVNSSLTSLGGNLIGTGDDIAVPLFTPGPGDQIGTDASLIDPMLGILADNGGVTATHALSSESPAIDAGLDSVANDNSLFYDQRGYPFDRFFDGNYDSMATVDVGAYEFVNHLPAASLFHVYLNEDTPTTVDITAADDDGDSVNYQIGEPENGLLSGAAPGITYTPDANFFGSDLFTYTASDGIGPAVLATVTLTVTSVNDDPVAVTDVFRVWEDTLYNELDVTVNDYDYDTDTGGYFWLNLTGTGNQGGDVMGDGYVYYSPAPDFYGTEMFTYDLADDTGAVSNTVTVTVHVTAVNDPPVADYDFAATWEDTPVTVNLLANDSDVDNDLFAPGDAPPESSLVITAVFDGPLTGGLPKGVELYAISDIPDLTLYGIAVASNGDGDADQDFALPSGSLTAGSYCYISSEEPGFTNFFGFAPDHTSGTMSINGDDAVELFYNEAVIDVYGDINTDGTGQPWEYLDSWAYRKTDTGPDGSNFVESNWTIIGANALDGETSNDTATDPVPIGTYSQFITGASLVTFTFGNPMEGSIVENGDGSITYTPNQDHSGSDFFTYTITDAGGATSDAATVSIGITPVNDAPVVVDDVFYAEEDNSGLTLDVLANDSDPESSTLSISSVGPVTGGTVYNEEIELYFDPDKDVNGPVVFTYAASDGELTSVATVTVNLTPVDDPPAVSGSIFIQTNEDTPVAIELEGTDPDGDTLSFSVGQPYFGSVVLAGSAGSPYYTYTPEPDYFSSDSFTYTVTDGNSPPVEGSVLIDVSPVNDPPIAVDDALHILEDSGTNWLGVLNNDNNTDGPGMMVETFGLPVEGGFLETADGDLMFTPDQDFFGTVQFTYTSTDTELTSNIATVTLTISNVNDAPTAATFAISTDENTSLPFTLVGDDIDNDPLLFVVGEPANGTLLLNGPAGGPDYTYTPTNGYIGSDGFTYSVSDNIAAPVIGFVNVFVTNVNDPPIAANDDFSIYQDDLLDGDLTADNGNDTDFDPDSPFSVIDAVGQPVPMEIPVLLPSGASVWVGPDGLFSYYQNGVYIPLGHGQTATDVFTYTISDGEYNSTATVTITVSGINEAPLAVYIEKYTLEDTPVGIDLTGHDLDGDPLTYAVGSPMNGTLTLAGDPDGPLYSYLPNPDFVGSDYFSYTISDGMAQSNEEFVDIYITSVNDVPIANPDSVTFEEDSMEVLLDVLSNDSDADMEALHISSVGQPAVGGMVYNEGLELYFDSSPDYHGTVTFTYTASDGQAESSPATVTLTISSVNDAPVAVDDVAEGMEDIPIIIDLVNNDSDVDGTVGTVTLVPPEQRLIITGVIDGPLTGGVPKAIEVYAVGDIADLSVYGIQRYSDDSTSPISYIDLPPYAVSAGTHFYISSDDTGFSSFFGFDSLIPGVVAVGNNGDDTVELLYGSSVVDRFGVVGTDGTGQPWEYLDGWAYRTNNSGPTGELFDPADWTFSDPNALDGETTNSSASKPWPLGTYTTSLHDSTNYVIALGAPLEGSVVDNGDGSVTYTPNSDFNNSDGFSYTVADNEGLASNVAFVSIVLTPVNDAPLARDDAFHIFEDEQAYGDLLGDNGSGPDEDVDSPITIIEAAGQPTDGGFPYTLSSGATLYVDAYGSVTYDQVNAFASLADGEMATDVFTYVIADEDYTSMATVTMNITGVNDPPVAHPLNITTDENIPIPFTLPADDVEDDTLIFSVGQPAGETGAVTVNGSVGGSDYIYTPQTGFTGNTSFTYSVTDSHSTPVVNLVSVFVSNINDPPIARDDVFAIYQDESLSSNLFYDNGAGEDVDYDSIFSMTQLAGMPPSEIAMSLPSGATIISSPMGYFTYEPLGAFTALGEGETTTDSFTYTISDGQYDSMATVTVVITGVNEPPLAQPIYLAGDEDNPVAVDLTATDADGDALSYTVGMPVSGSLTLVGDAGGPLYSYQPNQDFDGSDSFTYTVSDGVAPLEESMVTISITPLNDAPEALADTYHIEEDAGETFLFVLDNDKDPDGPMLEIFDVGQPAEGGETDWMYGEIAFYPENNYYGTVTFTYSIFDGLEISAPATVTVVISSVNDAPYAEDDSSSTLEDTQVTINLVANDYDVDGSIVISETIAPEAKLLITGIYDGPDSDPKGIELYVIDDIPDLSVYGVGLGFNGNLITEPNFSLPAGPVSGGTFLYFGNTAAGFQSFFGFAITEQQSVINFNGDDTVAVFYNSIIIDSYGEIGLDGTGTAWEYVDGWAYRNDNTGPNGDSFNPAEWTFSGLNVFDGQTSNDTTPIPFPIGSYQSDASSASYVVLDLGIPYEGSLTDNGDGTVVYTPGADFWGNDEFTYRIMDNEGLYSEEAWVSVVVSEVNDPPVARDDFFAVHQNEMIYSNLLGDNGFGSDEDLDSMFFVSQVGGQDAALMEPLDLPSGAVVYADQYGTFQYLQYDHFDYLGEGEYGTDQFTYVISDSEYTSQATVTVSITGLNDNPMGETVYISTDEDTPIPVTLLGHDPDANDVLVYTAGSADFGSVILSGDSGGPSYTYIPETGYTGPDGFTYSVSDGRLEGSGFVDIFVTNVNDPPIARDDEFGIHEENLLSGHLFDDNGNGIDFDPDSGFSLIETAGQPPAVEGVTLPSGATVSSDEFGQFEYIQGELFNSLGDGELASDFFTYIISDGEYQSMASVTITITGLNDLPVAQPLYGFTEEDVSLLVDLTASDPDGDPLTYTVGQPTNGTLTLSGDPDGPLYTYLPDPEFSGDDGFTYMVTDGFEYTALPDPGYPVVETVSIHVSPVNDAPVAVDDSFTGAEDAYEIWLDILDNDTDTDGPYMNIASYGQPSAGGSLDEGDGNLLFFPDYNFYGTVEFTYTVTDGTSVSNAATVTLAITPVNDAPEAFDDSASVAEDNSVIIDVIDNDSDVDGTIGGWVTTPPEKSLVITGVIDGPLTGGVPKGVELYVVYDIPDLSQYGLGVANNGEGTDGEEFTFPADSASAGSFLYVATESTGFASFFGFAPDYIGSALAVSGDDAVELFFDGVVVDVFGDINTDGTGTVWEYTDGWAYRVTETGPDGTVFVSANWTFSEPNALDNETSNDSASIAFPVGSYSQAPYAEYIIDITLGGAGHGTLTDNGDGTVNYTPNADYHGFDGFSYTVKDNEGLASNDAYVTIFVSSVNDPPIPQDDSFSVMQGQSVIAYLTDDNGNGADDDPDSSFWVSQVAGRDLSAGPGEEIDLPSGVALYAETSGYFDYMQFDTFIYLAEGDTIADSFTYVLTDGEASAMATVTVLITGVNDLPEAPEPFYYTNEDTSVAVDITAFDPDGDSLTYVVGNASEGTVSGTAPSLNYTPGSNYHGIDSFSYSVSDGVGEPVISYVGVWTTPVNDAPVAMDDSYYFEEDTTGVLLDVLFNDSDVDFDSLYITSVGSPSMGGILYNEEIELYYDAPLNFHGTITFTYTASDGDEASDVATVTLNITSVNDLPETQEIFASTLEDTPVALDLTATDVDGDSLSYLVGQPMHGTVSGTAPFITYTPADDYDDYDYFTYSVSDGIGQPMMAIVDIAITPVNDAPTTTGINDVSLDFGTFSHSIDLKNHFNDVEDGFAGLDYAFEELTNGALFESFGITNGVFNMQFSSGLAGSSVITIRVTDNGDPGLFVDATFTVTINESPTQTFTGWLSEFFTPEQLADPSLEATLWGPSADPDGDGIPNLIESFLGLNPLNDDGNDVMQLEITASTMTMTYPRAKGMEGLEGGAVYSADLQTIVPADVTETVIQDLGDTELVQATVTLPQGVTTGFMWIKVTDNSGSGG